MPELSTPADSPRSWVMAFLRGDAPIWSNGPEFVTRMLDCARPERAHVLLTEAMLSQREQSGLPGDVTDELVASLRQEFALEILRQETVSCLVAALAEAGLRCLLFKGTPLAYTLYPQACLRDRCDTDVLFESKAAADEAWLVLEGLGYERLNTPQGELVSYQFPCVRRSSQLTEMVDVHWASSNAVQLRPLSFHELWESSMPVPQLGAAARSPCHEHALVLSCLHRLAHVREDDGNKLIWLYDIHLLLLDLSDDQWIRFLACVEAKGVGSACLEGAERAQQYFSTVGCDGRIDQLRVIASGPGQVVKVHGSVLERDLSQLSAATGWRQRLQLLREYLFPDRHYMRRKYQSRSACLLPYYYFKRIVSGIALRLREHIEQAH